MIRASDIAGSETNLASIRSAFTLHDWAEESEALSHVFTLNLLQYSEKITQRIHTAPSLYTYLSAAAFHQEFKNWLRRLPTELTWNLEVMQHAGPRYFFLQ